MKHLVRSLPLLLLLLLAVAPTKAQDLAFSVGGWSFFRSAKGALPTESPGTFPSFGLTYGITRYMEAGVSIVPRLSPDAMDDIFIEEHIGFSLFGERVKKSGGPGIYLNALVDAGILLGAHNLLSGAPNYSRALFLRVTPFALGNPFYGRRDRMFSLGIIHDYDKAETSLFLNLIAVDFYLASPTKVH
ncbi:MAG TPA: hypothetical protein VN445_09935 [Rectinemataceae bacterium]|nr:hypothetical protein [Rectinemataceae bacterium]